MSDNLNILAARTIEDLQPILDGRSSTPGAQEGYQ